MDLMLEGGQHLVRALPPVVRAGTGSEWGINTFSYWRSRKIDVESKMRKVD